MRHWISAVFFRVPGGKFLVGSQKGFVSIIVLVHKWLFLANVEFVRNSRRSEHVVY